MTKEEYDTIIDKIKAVAGCKDCNSYDGVKCRACPFSDAMDCVDDVYNSD